MKTAVVSYVVLAACAWPCKKREGREGEGIAGGGGVTAEVWDSSLQYNYNYNKATLTHVGIKLNIGIQPGLSNPVPSSVEVFSFSPPLSLFLPPSALCIEYYCFCRNGTWMEEKGRTERKRHFFSFACHVVVMEGKEGERTFFDKNKKRLSL